jgi:peptide deformylase
MNILKLGDPRLRAISVAVEPGDPSLRQELQELAGALRSFRSSHGWGRAIALPQLGVAKRVIAFDLGMQPFFVMNPVLEWVSEEKFELWDDCMCMPEIAVRVERARSLTMSFVDESMQPRRLERVASDVAELIQHELDHLDGILLTDRMIPAWGVVARELREVAQPSVRRAVIAQAYAREADPACATSSPRAPASRPPSSCSGSARGPRRR